MEQVQNKNKKKNKKKNKNRNKYKKLVDLSLICKKYANVDNIKLIIFSYIKNKIICIKFPISNKTKNNFIDKINDLLNIIDKKKLFKSNFCLTVYFKTKLKQINNKSVEYILKTVVSYQNEIKHIIDKDIKKIKLKIKKNIKKYKQKIKDINRNKNKINNIKQIKKTLKKRLKKFLDDYLKIIRTPYTLIIRKLNEIKSIIKKIYLIHKYGTIINNKYNKHKK